ncbi:MAG: hypothetical protein LBI72_04615 [Flavobacteriaceae bacterium]|jgi:hypothetical protein|nr:hypothetical protein [Flavobacteriaceae bacterium]
MVKKFDYLVRIVLVLTILILIVDLFDVFGYSSIRYVCYFILAGCIGYMIYKNRVRKQD